MHMMKRSGEMMQPIMIPISSACQLVVYRWVVKRMKAELIFSVMWKVERSTDQVIGTDPWQRW